MFLSELVAFLSEILQRLFMFLSEIVQRLFIFLSEILQLAQLFLTGTFMLLTGTLHVLTMLVGLAGQFVLQIVPVLHLKLRAHGLDRSLQGAIATLGEVCTQLFILLLLLTKLQQEGVVEF